MKESAWALTNLSNPFRHRAAFARPAPPESESEHACVHVGWQLQQISHGEGRLRVTRRRNERQQALGVKLLAALEGCHLPSGCLGDLLPAWQPKMWTTVSNNYQQRASQAAECVSHIACFHSAAHLATCVITPNTRAGGAYPTPSADCCVSGHRASFTNHWFCCTTAKDTRRGFDSSPAVWRGNNNRVCVCVAKCHSSSIMGFIFLSFFSYTLWYQTGRHFSANPAIGANSSGIHRFHPGKCWKKWSDDRSKRNAALTDGWRRHSWLSVSWDGWLMNKHPGLKSTEPKNS